MNFSECISPEEEILNKKIVSSVESLKRRILKFNKNKKECLLCTEEFILHNVHDLIRLYALFMYCIKYHCTSVEELNSKDIFLIEIFLLSYIKCQDKLEIEYIVRYNENKNDILYKESLRKQLIAVYSTHYQEKIFKINCEQEIESLSYIYYKIISMNDISNYKDNDKINFIDNNNYKDNLIDNNNYKDKDNLIDNYKTNLINNNNYKDKDNIELLLITLFLRKEYFRFMKIFKIIPKNIFIIKLAILFEIEEDNEENLKRFYNELLKEDLIIKNNLNLKKYLKSINFNNFDFLNIFNLFKNIKDYEIWINELKDKIYYKNCIKLWSDNRSNNSSYVDNSMIDICIKYKKYEDGWIIYEICNKDTKSYLRGITLCCSAIKNKKHCKWCKRLLEIINKIFIYKKNINFESVLENILSKIENLSVNLIIKIINELQSNLIKINLSEEIIECLFNYYNLYCYTYQNTELNKICCQNSIYIYTKWNYKRTSKFNFFKKKTEYDTKIYSHILGICDISKNCEFFNKVCKDLIKNEAHISRELCRRLENYHIKNCKNCDYKDKQIVTEQESRGFISHLFN